MYNIGLCVISGKQLFLGGLSGVWVKCVTRTRTRVGKPALVFYELLKIIFGSKINAVKAQK